MKKLLLASAIAFATFSANAQETITFAMEPSYAPFETTNEKGEVIGFDIDIAKALCEELKATCEFKTQSFDSLIAGLKFKNFDAIISGMDITEARQKQVAFTNAYLENSVSYVAMKGKFTPETAKNVGVQNGTTFQQYLSKNAKQYNLKPYASLQSAVLDLKNGRVDMVFGDTPVLAEWLKTEKELDFVGEKVVDKAFFGNGYGIAVNKSNTALLEKLNSALATIKTNGKYEQIYNTWMAGK
ncbi:ABC transporter arginine-binding protein precursor [Mannheimia haemolytica]|uniref:ABC transporter arginine-binding protein n=1 Tax=Mannheimia haemolytica TaxID=75985 RepID=A0A448TDX7_MANHA|nr:transporter substrate-binding domain-containing protein [Mannheimia haemolytica]UQX68227.1 transporter substrate-binding domain-containing protein [Mannheimia haemolytica]STY63502.1 ABC transporter arginine-binding protein precursor [Mannheimia haemolytica]VEI78210.1 ABC transporter arginine-binding protein precursor [Mannheimia haemolytica]HDV7284828.1 transporter substrate-binding domain-containing protein [Mannheimia haemolytica]